MINKVLVQNNSSNFVCNHNNIKSSSLRVGVLSLILQNAEASRMTDIINETSINQGKIKETSDYL